MVVRRVDVVREEIEQLIRLGLLELCKSSDESHIDIERLQAGDGMRPDCRVVRIDRGSVGTNAPEV